LLRLAAQHTLTRPFNPWRVPKSGIHAADLAAKFFNCKVKKVE
jgi:hypothetical protein